MMKIPPLKLPLISSILILFTACSKEFDECFYLTDDITTKVYHSEKFEQVEIYVPGEYSFKQGKEHEIKITAHPRYLDSLNTNVHHGKLSITNRSPFCENKTDLKVEITLPKIKNLFFNAKSTIYMNDFVHQEDLTINLRKKSFVEINRFEGMHKFFVLLREDASIKTNTPIENIDSLQINIEVEGRFNGFNIPAKHVNIDILGKGYCEVNTIEKLHVVIKVNANVVAKDCPSLYKSITGKGEVYLKN